MTGMNVSWLRLSENVSRVVNTRDANEFDESILHALVDGVSPDTGVLRMMLHVGCY